MNDNKICVMQIVNNLDIGGAQEVVRTLAGNLEKIGCRSVVVTFKDGPLRTNIEHLGIPVEILPSRQHDITALRPVFKGAQDWPEEHSIKVIDYAADRLLVPVTGQG